MNRYLLGFLYPISRLISYTVFEKVFIDYNSYNFDISNIFNSASICFQFLTFIFIEDILYFYFFKLKIIFLSNISGAEDKRGSLYDGIERWDIPSLLAHYIHFSG